MKAPKTEITILSPTFESLSEVNINDPKNKINTIIDIGLKIEVNKALSRCALNKTSSFNVLSVNS